MEIRKARAKDLPAILRIYASAMDGGHSLKANRAQIIFKKMQSYPNYTLYVASDNEQILGVFALLIMDNLARLGAPSGIVEDVAVLPEWQGRGIGKGMMRFALDRCRKAKCYKMSLSSNLKRTAAHKFYDALGFKKHGYSFLVNLP